MVNSQKFPREDLLMNSNIVLKYFINIFNTQIAQTF